MVLQQVLNKIMAGVFDDSPTFLKACYGKPLVIYFFMVGMKHYLRQNHE